MRERVRAGVKRAQDNGVKFGRPHVGFDMGKAIKLRKEGISIRKMAKQLGVSKSTLADRLKELE
jgi:DNA invertase Pin-like site-specific DNA recombinase